MNRFIQRLKQCAVTSFAESGDKKGTRVWVPNKIRYSEEFFVASSSLPLIKTDDDDSNTDKSA
jgi:hypothetical protein